MASPTITNEIAVPDFLAGGGEMGKLIRSKNWFETPLGSPDSWPQSLRTTISLCIASNFPISITWGPHRVQIYNDGYWPITGDKHPASMGQDFKECWISAWPVIGQAFEEASLGQTRFLENQRIFLDRFGYIEETFFTFSFSPILDESGGVGGLFHPVVELTQQTLAERRLNIIRAVAEHTVNATTTQQASALIMECLKDFELDVPFALLYSIANNGKEATLEGAVGVEAGLPIAPSIINLQEQQSNGWPFTEAIEKGKVVQVEELSKIFGKFTCPPYPEPPERALIFPVTLHGTANNNYLLVMGVSSRRSPDEKYLLFFELLTASITNALTKARAHDEERKKAEALAEIDKAKTVFFSNLSHEFRTPLTLMLGSLEELLNSRDGEMDVAHKDAIKTSHRNAMRLLKMVNNLLDFSRLEAGRVQAQYQLTDIAKYTTELASNFRSVVENAGLIFQVKTDAVIQPVYLDKEMWEKIVFNLLSNAFKYTLKGSITITLDTAPHSSSAEEGLEVRLKVTDTGVGIPAEELPKMFQRFHRVQNVVGRTHEGTGIGLSLVSELVKLHGGKIAVQSTQAEGSVFTVSIPTGKSHLPTEHVFEKEIDFTASLCNAFVDESTTLIDQSVLNGNGTKSLERTADAATVLVVDDNADMRAYIKNLLQKHYHVVTANNGMEALHQIKEHAPHLILSDIMMPVMDGIGLLKAVKENVQTKNIPVILLTARAGEESKIEGYETGADDYLVKPFSAKELLARVASQIKLVAMRRATEANVRNLFMQAPAIICVLRGPEHIYELANAMYLQLINYRDIVGKPIREALPEVEGTGIFEILDAVYTTGEPFIANELPVTFLRESGKLEEGFFNFIYQASLDANGHIDGILVHAVEVTDQVMARKKIEESEHRYQEMIYSSPSMISILKGEDMMIEIANDSILQSWGKGKDIIGKSLLEALPEVKEQGFDKLLLEVYKTGNPYHAYETPVVYKRNGKTETVYYNFFYQAQRGINGIIDGVVIIASEVTPQATFNKQLRESEQRFQNLVREATVGIILLTGEEMKVEIVNDAYGKLIGRRAAELFGKNLFEIIPEAEDFLRPIINGVRNSGEELYLHDTPYSVWADGEKIEGYLNLVCQPYKEADGTVSGLMILCQDVTETVKAKKALEASENRFRLMADAIQEVVWVADAHGRTEFFNKRWEEFSGVPFEPATVAEVAAQFLHPDDVPAVMTAFGKAIREGKPMEVEQRNRSATGEYRWFLNRATPYRKHQTGEIEKWFGIAIDIHERKGMEQALTESESRFRSLADQSPMIVYLIEPDAAATMSYFNKSWLDYTGQTFEDAIGRAWNGIVHPDDLQEVLDIYVPAFMGQRPFTLPAVRLKRYDGEYRWHLFKGNPRYFQGGEFIGFVGVGFDVHEQKMIEEKLEALVAERTMELQRSNEDLQQFAHVASHDLKEPVRKIRTFGNRLTEEFGTDLPEKAKIYIEKMDSAATRLSTMIDGVLVYSSLDSGKLPNETINLNEIISNIEEDLELIITQKNAVIQYRDLPTIEGSSILIYQLFYNLINNSLKFSKKDFPAHLKIDTKATNTTDLRKHNLEYSEKEYVKIIVKDNGIGFGVNDEEKIFKTFLRLHSKDLYEGTGLGLALCKKIVERHHGAISAKGEETEGASFEIILPVKQGVITNKSFK